MTWDELAGTETVQLRDSPVESDRFGLKVARMVVPVDPGPEAPPGSPGTVEDVRAVAAGSDADVLIVRHPSQRLALPAALLGGGRVVLPADTLLYWRLRAGEGRGTPPPEGMVVSTTVQPDPDELRRLVEEAYADYTGHYRANPLFDPDAVTAGYIEWVHRTLDLGELVTVWEDGRLSAFMTTEPCEDSLELVLSGVDKRSRGRGTYAQLLNAGERIALAHGLPFVNASTQAQNTVVQRTWGRLGYEPVASFTTLHVVRRGLLDG